MEKRSQVFGKKKYDDQKEVRNERNYIGGFSRNNCCINHFGNS